MPRFRGMLTNMGLFRKLDEFKNQQVIVVTYRSSITHPAYLILLYVII